MQSAPFRAAGQSPNRGLCTWGDGEYKERFVKLDPTDEMPHKQAQVGNWRCRPAGDSATAEIALHGSAGPTGPGGSDTSCIGVAFTRKQAVALVQADTRTLKVWRWPEHCHAATGARLGVVDGQKKEPAGP